MKRMKKEKERERKSEMRRMERRGVTRKTGVRGFRKGTREEKGRRGIHMSWCTYSTETM